MRVSNAQIIERWREEVCKRSRKVDPGSEFDWQGVWAGFVIGCGRPDLANYMDYMRLGYPEEG